MNSGRTERLAPLADAADLAPKISFYDTRRARTAKSVAAAAAAAKRDVTNRSRSPSNGGAGRAGRGTAVAPPAPANANANAEGNAFMERTETAEEDSGVVLASALPVRPTEMNDPDSLLSSPSEALSFASPLFCPYPLALVNCA